MYEKVFISFLVLALTNFLVGCYSLESITVPEYKQIEEEDKPDDIRVITKNAQEYNFSESNFYVENDTLYGKEIFLSGYREQQLDRKIALDEIRQFQLEKIDWYSTSLAVFSVLLFVGLFVFISSLDLPGN